MATSRPPSGGSTPQARLGIDLSQFQRAPQIAREAGRGVARELQAALRIVHEQERQVTAAIKGQQAQATATAKAAASERVSIARTEFIAKEQALKRETIAFAEAEKRKTAVAKAEIRERERAARQSQASAGAFGRGAATFAGAALGGPIGGLAGALAGGSPALAAGLAVGQGARFALEASQTAVAYNRQSVAAVNLAGSQAKLNDLLRAYERASGGAVDKATALANVTRLQAVGFADNAAEVDVFTRAVRGSSIAMGKLQDEISQEVQLAISNQSLKRLDQIGLGISEVNTRIAELRANNQGMTREAAFQEAVLGLLNEKFGALADSAEGQASGTERLTKAWKDMRLELGQDIQVNINQATGALADLLGWINRVRDAKRQFNAELRDEGILEARRIALGRGEQPFPTLTSGERSFVSGSAGRDAGRHAGLAARRASASAPEFSDEQSAIMVERFDALNQITHNANRAILDSTRQFESQRAKTISQYEQSIAREAADFGRQRLNAETKLGMAILDVAQDSARQRVKWEQDLERNIAQAQADSAERVAEARTESAKRAADLEEKFAKDRLKAQRDLSRNLLDAAGRLDANQVYELQRNFAEQEKEAKEAHSDQIGDLRAQLKERETEESKALEKSNRLAREANQRRIDEQAENDRLRIAEMQAAYEAQKVEEDAQRAIMLGRRAEDHAAQLLEMENAHAERIAAIGEQEAEALAEQNKAFDERLLAEGVHNAKLEAEQTRHQVEAERSYKAHIDALDAIVKGQMQGPPRGPREPAATFPSLADPYQNVPPVASVNSSSSISNSRSITIGDINPTIVIGDLGGRSDAQIKALFIDAMTEYLEDQLN